MTSLVRTAANPGRVIGVTTAYTPRSLPGVTTPLQSYRSAGNIDSTRPQVSIRATKAVILATGGSTSNVNFRRMFDPRLTEVYQTAGEPYTFQDASGELAAMAIGASLWGLGNQILENGDGIRTQRALGARYNYFAWDVHSPILPLVRAAGLEVADWQNLILVNQLGQRFYDETKGDYPNGNLYNEFTPYTHGDYRNNARIDYNPTQYNFFNAAVAMNAASGPPDYAAGPIWAIFDADAVAREQWQVDPAVCGSGRLFLQRQHPGRSRRRHSQSLSGTTDRWPHPASDGGALQCLCRLRDGSGFRQAQATVQDPDATVLRRLGYAARARYACGSQDQRAVPGDGHAGPGDPRPVLRW